MKNHIIIISLLTLAYSLNGSCFSAKRKVNPASIAPTVSITLAPQPVLIPTQYEKRADGTYWDFHPSRGWKETGYVQFYQALSKKKMSKTNGADGKPVYKIGEFLVNEASFKWVADRRKETKKSCCVIC